MQTVKNFFWKVTHPRAIASLELFVKLSAHRGEHHNVVLLELIDNYNRQYLDANGLGNGRSLVDENELMLELESQGLRISHQTLMKYKRNGTLGDENGNRASWSNGYRVVYNLPIVKKRVREQLGKYRQAGE